MIKVVYHVEITNDDAGNGVHYYPPMIMRQDTLDFEPDISILEKAILDAKGNGATVIKKYILI